MFKSPYIGFIVLKEFLLSEACSRRGLIKKTKAHIAAEQLLPFVCFYSLYLTTDSTPAGRVHRSSIVARLPERTLCLQFAIRAEPISLQVLLSSSAMNAGLVAVRVGLSSCLRFEAGLALPGSVLVTGCGTQGSCLQTGLTQHLNNSQQKVNMF